MKHHTDYHLDFLRTKIETAGTALCTLHHPAFFIKTHIIHTIKVDEQGNIWFKILQPASKVAIDLHAFSVTLTYFKKKLDFYLKIEALATAVEDDGVLWVTAKIMKAEYSEIHSGQPKLGLSSIQSFSKKVMQLAGSFF